jgi:hypothetical protein
MISTAPIAEGTSLKGAKLFSYSFLDVRDTEFGPSMLSEIDKQLAAELGKSNIVMKTLRFKDSEPAKFFVSTNAGMTVPVKQVLDSNAPEEVKFGADYRLVIFPSKMTLSGAWKFYDIRWDVFDVKTGKRVWGSISQGKHLTMWKADEDPQGRAKTIIDAVVGEMRKGGVI